MSDIAIQVTNIQKIYRLYEKPIDRLKESLSFMHKRYSVEYRALDGVSLRVNKGETVAIIGINGAGKSTLLKILTGVLSATHGDVLVNGTISALLELGTGFNPEYTGIENIYLNGAMRGFTEEAIDEKIKGIIQFADIGEFIYQPVKTYSSGMFARLAFAVAINVEPEILIVDEALSVGDIFFQQKCNQYMKENMEGVTKLIVTHDMHTVSNMADRVIVLEKGKVIFDGRTSEGIECYLKKMHNQVYKIEKESVDQTDFIDQLDTVEEGWVTVQSEQLGGAQQIKIKEVNVCINNTSINVVKPNDQVTITMKVISEKNTDQLIVGYTFKDKYGNAIFAQNTIGQGIRIDPVEQGKVYIMTLDIVWPEVKEGDYFLTMGVGDGIDQMIHTIECWAHNIFHVEAMSNKPMHGIINQDMQAFRMKEHK